jgi:hypothetical protein
MATVREKDANGTVLKCFVYIFWFFSAALPKIFTVFVFSDCATESSDP